RGRVGAARGHPRLGQPLRPGSSNVRHTWASTAGHERVMPMRTIIAAVAAGAVLLAPGLLAPGVAAADDPDEFYEVSRSWTLTRVDGERRIVPRTEDGVCEVTCHNEDIMREWRVNDEDLIDDWSRRADGTGIQIKPEFPNRTVKLRITIECERS